MSKKTSLRVTCHHCHGRGKIDLPEELLQTLNIMTPNKGAEARHLILPGMTLASAYTRLHRLRKLGLVRRERSGRSFIWMRN